MATCQHWYADGTFKSSPPLFNQVYTVHAVKYNNVLPSVFVLMTERNTNAYTRVLMELKRLQPLLNPASIMTDFEHAALTAWSSVFPDAVQRGCLFHLCQCIWRKVQQIPGLQLRYTEDPEMALQIRQLAALAFVPVQDVVRAFDELMESAFFTENEDALRDLTVYFEDSWIGRPGRRGHGRTRPAFPHSLWNVYISALGDLPKTNNAVEGWHRGFHQLLGAYHPTIWKFIDGLKKEQSLNELKIEQFIAGQPPEPVKRVYRDTAARLKSLVEEYSQRPVLDYLRGIAYNLSLQV